MKAGAGNLKGGAFERAVCRRLSLWVSNGTRYDIFYRSAMSGGLATIELRKGRVNVVQSGDICAVDPLGYPFVRSNFIELKHYKDLALARGFVCDTGTIARFWRKTCGEAAKYGKRPLLIACQNYYPTLAITNEDPSIFTEVPIMKLRRWDAWVYHFDEVTRVKTRMMRRVS